MSVTEQEKEHSISQLIAAIDLAYNKAGVLFWRSFLSGLFSGLGATIGVAIVIALIGFLVRKLGGLPVIGTWLNDLGQVLPSRH